jgi:hypothetical protein
MKLCNQGTWLISYSWTDLYSFAKDNPKIELTSCDISKLYNVWLLSIRVKLGASDCCC